jgi:hypothetical protein
MPCSISACCNCDFITNFPLASAFQNAVASKQKQNYFHKTQKKALPN